MMWSKDYLLDAAEATATVKWPNGRPPRRSLRFVMAAIFEAAWPSNLAPLSMAGLMRRTGYSEPTVREAVRDLESLGVIVVTREAGVGACYSMVVPGDAPVEVSP
jgi:DNA-binding FadR family transcriptional regulator